MSPKLLEVNHMQVYFPVKGSLLQRQQTVVKAVDDISFYLNKGETMGLVGESGCGKTSAGRAILRLIQPTGGKVLFEGEDLASMPQKEMRNRRRELQMIFQDPYSSLNPRLTVEEILGEPLKAHRIGDARLKKEMIAEIMEICGLNPAYRKRYAHEFSGGQRQRLESREH